MEDYMKDMSIDNNVIVASNTVRTADPGLNTTETTSSETVANTAVTEEVIASETKEGEAVEGENLEAVEPVVEPVEGEIAEITDVSEEAVEGEAVDAVVVEEGTDDIASEDVMVEEISSPEMGIDPIVDGVMPGMEGGGYDETMGMGMELPKDPLLSSWPAVIGISGAVLLVSILLGALLAKRKIKKGIDLYED